MTIELKISGDHATDVITEIKLLAEAFGVNTTPVEPPFTVADGMARAKELAKQAQTNTVVASQKDMEAVKEKKPELGKTLESDDSPVEVAEEPVVEVPEKKEKKIRKWGAVKQGKAIDEMVEKGEIIEEHLPYMSDKNIERAKEKIAEKLEAIDKGEDDEITLEDFRQLANERGKDEDGNQVPAKMVEIRKIIVKYVPDGMDIKMSNMDEAKISEAYAEVKAL